jgi:hypothetical protein
LAGLQAAIDCRAKVRGVQLMNISLRMLHASKQSPWSRPYVKALQDTLRTTQLGRMFFASVAKPQASWAMRLATGHSLSHLACRTGNSDPN